MRLAGLLCLLAGFFFGGVFCLAAQEFVISEFMAANGSVIKDTDGEEHDWIEIFNLTGQSASLSGWYLTDDRQTPAKWRFPNVRVPAHGFLVVFASGKNRIDPTRELHANFSLSRNGEYLALIKPDATTVATEFAPTFPRQVTDVSYGFAMTVATTALVPSGASGRMLVPGFDEVSPGWIRPEFDDGAWPPVRLSVGYRRTQSGSSESPEPPLTFEDVTRPSDFIVATSGNSPANEGVINAIDNSPATKYLNFDKLNAGLRVAPIAGSSVVSGLRLTSANDAPDRDPTSFVLSGSNDGVQFIEIARGPILLPNTRFSPVTVSFNNRTAWAQYSLIFPTVRAVNSAVAVQIAEVEFLGYVGDPPSDFTTSIRTDIESLLYGKSLGLLVRIPFTLADLRTDGRLLLRLRYEDGVVVHLNGVEVARVNAPATVTVNSTAMTNRTQRAAGSALGIDLTDNRRLLRAGLNLLALHGLNSQIDSRDFLLDAQLEFVRVAIGERGYFGRPTPGTENEGQVGGLVDDVTVTPERGFLDGPSNIQLKCGTPESTLRYTTDGTSPSMSNGLVYVGPIRITRTTPLRVAAFRNGWRPSRVTTHSYLLLDDVVSQNRAKAIQAGYPATWNGVSADYGLDSRVVGTNGTDLYGGRYATTLKADLRSLPTMSLVMPVEDLFGPQGIYARPDNRGGAWERATSIELLYPDGRPGFQENAGLRIQGGAFRRFDLSLKKSFRVVFRERYGATELRYRLFGDGATDRFDNFVLRANSNDGWPYGGERAVYVRDAFAMESARAMGIPSSHTGFVHLYINGWYWGLYNTVERPDAAFSEAYIGGSKDTWDSINQDSAPDGNYDAWNRLLNQLNQDLTGTVVYQRLQGNNPDGTRNPAYENLLNVGNMIDYLILNFYVGNTDWPGRNWWAGRDRADGDGFTFRPWDTETALGIGDSGVNVTGASDAVARPYASLRSNADFRMEFADHVYLHFYHGGTYYVNSANSAWDPRQPENNQPAARFAGLADRVRSAVVGESARWGDQLRATPFTRDEHWQKERDRLLKSYFPGRSAAVLAQFRQAGLYPKTDPPVMNQRGGTVPERFQLTLTAPVGIVYYTLNGTDPRKGADRLRYEGPLTLKDLTTIRARTLNGLEWSALNEATFVVGTPRLLLSELHYHPSSPTALERAAGFADADDFEFLELVNGGSTTFDLGGLRLTTGITFEFPGGTASRLAVGDYVLVVRNRAAFEKRYGPGRPVAGEYAGKLDNAGERVVLLDRAGRTVLDFRYGTTGSWPRAADGSGPSLDVLDPAGELNADTNWRASALLGGTPGETNITRPLSLEVFRQSSGSFRLRFGGRVGSGYSVEVTEALQSGRWRIWRHGEVQIRSGPVEVSIGLDPAFPHQFFRVSIP